MSSITNASGGNGWCGWTVQIVQGARYEVVVTSRAELVDSQPKELHRSDSITDGIAAIQLAQSKCNEYAARMAS